MSTFTVCRKDGIGETQTVDATELLAVCELLSDCGQHALNVAPVTIVAPTEPAPAPVFSTFADPVSDDAARERIEALHATLAAQGVAVPTREQLFATGTRMADIGYQTQATRKVEHDAKLPLLEAAAQLRAAVQSEQRTDREMTARELGQAITVNGKVAAFGLCLTEQAIRGLSTRLESPMLGYILGLRERISTEVGRGDAKNSAAIQADKARMAEILVHECGRNPDVILKLRTRATVGDVFAIVSPGYTPADAPEMLSEIEQSSMPKDARATWAYDPCSTAWEMRASVWTPTPTDEQAVGEPFEGYVSYSSRDNGTSRFRGGGGISLIRCLNASTYTAGGAEVNRVHRRNILRDVDAMLRASLASIHVLCQAWGEARADVIDAPTGMKINDAVPGFWRYLLRDRSSELATVLPGRTEAHVKGLTTAFAEERRNELKLVRADFAQGWTSYIQNQPSAVRREAEAAIGGWVVSGSPVRHLVEGRA
jgi:hypothetical protein